MNTDLWCLYCQVSEYTGELRRLMKLLHIAMAHILLYCIPNYHNFFIQICTNLISLQNERAANFWTLHSMIEDKHLNSQIDNKRRRKHGDDWACMAICKKDIKNNSCLCPIEYLRLCQYHWTRIVAMQEEPSAGRQE